MKERMKSIGRLLDSEAEQINLRQSLLRVSELMAADHALTIRSEVRETLKQASCLVDVRLIEGMKGFMRPLEELLGDMRERIRGDVLYPDYLLQFRKGELFRGDLEHILKLMSGARAAETSITENEWVIREQATAFWANREDVDREMAQIFEAQKEKPGQQNLATEYRARFALQERLRADILAAAAKNTELTELARRMPALMAGHLGLMTHGIETQISALFKDQNFELGDNDLHSMRIAIDGANRCLLAHLDYSRTKQVIPALE